MVEENERNEVKNIENSKKLDSFLLNSYVLLAFFEIVSVFAPGYGLEYLAFGIKDLIIGVGFWAASSHVQES